jgi:N-methylhydantoinase A
VERGFDPRGFALVAFGGAGPLLASTLAGELGISTVIVPANPGVLCALGLLVADVRSDFGLTRIMNLDRAFPDDLNRAVSEVAAEATAWFDRERVPPRRRKLERAIDMRYVGQSHELTVELPDELQRRDFTERDRDPLVQAFLRDHERVYGYAPEAPIQLVTFRVSARAEVSRPSLVEDAVADGGDAEAAWTGTRRIHFTESRGYVDCPVYDRARLTGSAEIPGPAVVEQMDATTVILPGQIARRDSAGNLVLTTGVAAGHGVAARSGSGDRMTL